MAAVHFLGLSFSIDKIKAKASTELQEAIDALSKTQIGAVVADDIKALTDKTMSGQQKFEAVVTKTLPLVVSLALTGGFTFAEKEVEDVTRALVQKIYNETVSSTAFKVAQALLKIVGIKI